MQYVSLQIKRLLIMIYKYWNCCCVEQVLLLSLNAIYVGFGLDFKMTCFKPSLTNILLFYNEKSLSLIRYHW